MTSSTDPSAIANATTEDDVEEEEAMDIDPAIAEAMGFSGFGMQSTSSNSKKRKHGAGADDAFTFVDTRKPTASAASGANTTVPRATDEGSQRSGAAAHPNSAKEKPRDVEPDGKPTLEALRRGVRNEDGDMVYFLPSFIEDPWKGLEGK